MTNLLFSISSDLPHFVAVSASGLSAEYPVAWVIILVLLLLVNAFFVAAETAHARVHTSQLESADAEGKLGAARAIRIQTRLDAYLTACRIGSTLATLMVGAMGTPFVIGLISPFFANVNMTETSLELIAFFVSVFLISSVQMLVSQQIPRALGFWRTVDTALVTSAPLRVFHFLVAWPIWLIEKVSHGILRVFFRLDPIDTSQPSADDLKHLVEETGRAQEVTETEQEILRNALELNELTVRDILTPRNEVVVLDVNLPFKENLDIALESKHTRFPLVDRHLDKTLGLIHIKDLLREMQRESLNLFAAKRDMLRVSEKVPLDELLQLFLAERAHVALVVDEFGGSGGLVMFDDVLDQVVGEIRDEFDEVEEPGFQKISDDEFIVEGTLPLHELADHVGELDLDASDVSTVGGYITSSFGMLPEVGEQVMVKNYLVEVLKADERSIQEAKFVKQAETDTSAEADSQEEVTVSAPDLA